MLASRAGLTVEIGNTDAEGRLILADALALADAEAPDLILDFSTLTGAARVALGPDLPAFFTPDDALTHAVAEAGQRAIDPVWRMPLHAPYASLLDSKVADLNNVSNGPFAGRSPRPCSCAASPRRRGRTGISTSTAGTRRRSPAGRRAARCRPRG